MRIKYVPFEHLLACATIAQAAATFADMLKTSGERKERVLSGYESFTCMSMTDVLRLLPTSNVELSSFYCYISCQLRMKAPFFFTLRLPSLICYLVQA